MAMVRTVRVVPRLWASNSTEARELLRELLSATEESWVQPMQAERRCN